MADIEALCRRVIIIDHGKIFFDGRLDAVVDRLADFKHITIHCDGADGSQNESLAKYGEVIEKSSDSVKLKVKRDPECPICGPDAPEVPDSEMGVFPDYEAFCSGVAVAA